MMTGKSNNDELVTGLVRVGDTLHNFGNDVSSAMQQISNTADKARSSIREIGDTADRVGNMLGSVKDIAELYTQCVAINGRTRQVEAVTQLKLAQTVAKFKLGELFLTQSFGERNEALQHNYKVLDKAIEDGNTGLILAAMSNISGIVTTSPLDELERLYERFDDPTDSLLDF